MDNDYGGPKEPCIRWGCSSPKGRDNFGSCSDNSKALAIFAASVAANGIIQSPITSCNKRNNLVCQESGANYSTLIFWAQAMRPIGRVEDGRIAQRGRSLISTIAWFESCRSSAFGRLLRTDVNLCLHDLHMNVQMFQ